MATLAELAGDGGALEFADGTRRSALPPAERGVRVAGMNSSKAMLQRLCEKPGADRPSARVRLRQGLRPISSAISRHFQYRAPEPNKYEHLYRHEISDGPALAALFLDVCNTRRPTRRSTVSCRSTATSAPSGHARARSQSASAATTRDRCLSAAPGRPYPTESGGPPGESRPTRRPVTADRHHRA